MPDAVAIVGMGAVFPGAPDLATYASNLERGVDAITAVPASRWDPIYFDPAATAVDRFYCRRGGFIEPQFDPIAFGLMPKAIAGAEPDQLLALHVAAAALADAGYGGERPAPRDRTGVILGRGGYLTPGMARLANRVRTAQQLVTTLAELVPDLDAATVERIRAAFQAKSQSAELGPEAAIGLVPNLAASRIANRLDLRGPAYTIDAACASSLLAIDQGCRELATERCDLVVAGGVHVCHDVTLWSVFTQLGALSRNETIRPFDRRADGILIGEGAGIVILKRLADAERDGDRIYAVIRGTGVSSDGRDSSAMRPNPDGQRAALAQAWQGSDRAAVGLVEAHGTATPTGDGVELSTLAQFFGTGAPVVLGSVKSMIGHAMPAAGIAGLIKVALAVHRGVLPPSLHCEEPHEALAGSRFRVLPTAEPWGDAPRRAGVSAFGFGGINAHVVIEGHAQRKPARRTHELAVARFTGATIDELRAALARSGLPDRAAPPNGGAESIARSGLPDRAAPPNGGAESLARSGLPDRAAPPNGGVESLARSGLPDRAAPPNGGVESLARSGLPDRAAPPNGGAESIDGAPPGSGPLRLALLDPTPERRALAHKVLDRGKPWRGNHDIWFAPRGFAADGHTIAFVFPGVEAAFGASIADVASALGIAAPPAIAIAEAAGNDQLEERGAGVFALGRLLATALARLGVAPAAMAGHSLGEWTGMAVSEMITPADVDAFVASLPPGLEVPDVLFAAVGCSADGAQAALEGLDAIGVSHDNCPHQSILCGRAASIRTAIARLGQRGVLCQELPFRSGFHSPLFADYVEPHRRRLATLTFQHPRVPLWSATTCAPYPEAPEAIRTLAIDHLVQPVRFRELIDALYASGVRTFIQLGAGSAGGFIDDTLRGRDHLAIAAAAPKGPGLTQLARVSAALWTEGYDVGFDLDPRRADVPPPRAPTTRAIALQLGAPLVRLGDPALRITTGSAPVDAGGDPVLAELLATIDDATTASRAIVDAYRISRRPRAQTTRRTLSVDAVPALIDHCFYRQPPDWPVVSDRYPVVPMTMTINLMIEAARALAPERVAIAVEDIRAYRWLAVAPPVDVEIAATARDADRIERSGSAGPRSDAERSGDLIDVEIPGYSRATVRLADRYPAAPPARLAPLTNSRGAPVTADRMYVDRWMFHGPQYQGVVTLGPLGDDGVDGEIAATAAPGALLDNAGQLMGWWVMQHEQIDRLAMPVRIAQVALFAPEPPAGERVACAVRMREVGEREVRADLELVAGGRVWCAIEGWEDRRFDSDDTVWNVLRWPEHHALAEPCAGGYVRCTEHWHAAASRELMMRRYLGERERHEHDALALRGRRAWLLGRMAIKDAVRRHVWARDGAMPLWPVEISVHNEPSGKPVVTSRFGDLRVSVAHKDDLAVAIVGEGYDVGIDVETIAPRTTGFAGIAFTPAELARGVGREPTEWQTRLWAAKEAVAKLRGTGMTDPRRLEAHEVVEDRLLVDGESVDTVRDGDHIIAWTTRRVRA